MALVVNWVVDPIRHHLGDRIRWKVVTVDINRLAAPPATGVLEQAHFFPLFRVDADPRVPGHGEHMSLLGDMSKLGIAIDMAPGGESLPVPTQPIPIGPKQTTQGRRTSPVTLGLGQSPKAGANPLGPGLGAPGRLRFNKFDQVRKEGRIFLKTPLAPPPGCRTRSVGRPRRSSSRSSRPRRMVSGCIPVMAATRLNPPCPKRRASRAATQRRCCSSSRDRIKLSRRCWSATGPTPSRHSEQGHV